MGRFILRRVVRGLVALFLFQSLLFALLHALPYDFSAFTLGSSTWRAFIRHQFGLDLSLWEQYTRWLRDFARFDLGGSYQYWPTPVSHILLNRMPRTLILFLSAVVLSYLFGIWLGKVMAWRRGGVFEAVATLGGVAAYTSFAPWLGFMALNIFGRYLGWFPNQRLIDHNLWFRTPVTLNEVLARVVVTGALAFGALLLTWHVTRRIRSRRQRWTWRMRVPWTRFSIHACGVGR